MQLLLIKFSHQFFSSENVSFFCFMFTYILIILHIKIFLNRQFLAFYKKNGFFSIKNPFFLTQTIGIFILLLFFKILLLFCNKYSLFFKIYQGMLIKEYVLKKSFFVIINTFSYIAHQKFLHNLLEIMLLLLYYWVYSIFLISL